MELIRTYAVHLKIVNERVTRHGDYRTLPDGSHLITVNAMANKLMLPFLRPEIFPPRLLPLLARHFRNPRASSSTDTALSLALREYDPRPRDKQYVFELPEGSCFRLYNGRIFRKGPKKIKRYQCVELNTGKLYLFQPQAEVEWLSER
jgi:hypothetical protein